MIAIVAHNVFSVPNFFWTKTLTCALKVCFLWFLFDAKYKLRPNSVSRKRCIFLGLVALFFLPLHFSIHCLVYMCEMAEDIYSRRLNGLMELQITHYAKWKLRLYNELEHEFLARLSRIQVRRKTSRATCILARCVSFVAGSFVGVITIVAFFDANLLMASVLNRTLMWWFGVFATSLTIARGVITAPAHQVSHQISPQLLVFFKTRFAIMLSEIFSVLMLPVFFLCILPFKTDKIATFIQTEARYIDGLGCVCGESMLHQDSKHDF